MIERVIDRLAGEGKSSQTLLNYRTSWNRFVTWFGVDGGPDGGYGGAGGPHQATQKDIANFKRFAVNNFKPSTVELTFKHLRVIYRHFVEMSLIPDNPASDVKVQSKARTTPKWLSRNEQNALIRTARSEADLREYTMILFMLRTGVRVHELADVRLTDLTISDRKGSVYIRGKMDKDREIPLNGELRNAISAYLAKHHPKGTYLFDTQRSEQCTTRAIQSIIEKYRELTSIKHLTAHALRHTFGHDLVSEKFPLDLVARLMGHFKNDGTPNISQTIVYTTPSMDDMARAVESLSWT